MEAKAAGIIVVKIGGSTLGGQDTTLEDLVTLQGQGYTPVVVHGGGKTISEWMERQGLHPRFVRGLRVTDKASLEVVTAVLTGLINKSLVASLLGLGARAVGISGVDGGLLQARIEEPELGLVGRVVKVDPAPLQVLVKAGFIPIVAPVSLQYLNGTTLQGTLLNVNADTAAGKIAVALNAESLVILTDVEGVLDTSQRLIKRLTPQQAQGLMASGTAAGGMIPKLEACIHALERVSTAHIVDGREPHALLNAVEGKATGTRLGEGTSQYAS